MQLRTLLLFLLKLKLTRCSSFDGSAQWTHAPLGGAPAAALDADAAFRPPAFDLRDSSATSAAFAALAYGPVGPAAVGVQGSMSATKTGTTIVGVSAYVSAFCTGSNTHAHTRRLH
jgi:hypothetical protein